MAGSTKIKGAIKFLFWGALSVVVVGFTWRSYTSGQMISWYYYKAAEDGYAINSKTFMYATREKPALLAIGQFDRINGLQAVRVKKGERLPQNVDGIISDKIVKEGKRGAVDGNILKITVPTEIEESKGFKFKDSFKHKGIVTNQWSGVWNLLLVVGLGLTLGFTAEGFTDMLGIKIRKIKHFEGAH